MCDRLVIRTSGRSGEDAARSLFTVRRQQTAEAHLKFGLQNIGNHESDSEQILVSIRVA